jgi:hypothetical protein
MRLTGHVGQIFIFLICLFGGHADGQTPVDWLPSSTMLYGEVKDPSGLLEIVESHPMTRQLLELPQAQEAMKSKQFRDLKLGISIAEVQMDASWQEILAQVAGQGIIIAVDGESDAVALMLHANSAENVTKSLNAIERLAKLDAATKGGESEVKTGEYRGLTAYSAGSARWVKLGEWIAITNHSEFGKAVIDRYLDKSQDTLASKASFSNAIQTRGEKSDVWAWVNVAQLREKNPDEAIYQQRTDNPIAELLFGGLLDIASQTKEATFSVSVNHESIQLTLTTPWDARWIPEPREYFWGFGGTGEAPGTFEIENAIFQLSAYRDLSEMWLRAEELLQDDAVDGIVQANSVLSTLFSGKDFGEDILAELEPTIDVVVTKRSFPGDQPQPSVKLPAFALAFELSDPETMQPQFKRIFQSLIGFINITGAMNGQPQLELDIERTEDAQFVLGRFLVEEEYDGGLPLQFNLSPTLGFSGSRFVLSSDLNLAKELVKAERNLKPQDEEVVNVTAEASLQNLSTVMSDNRQSLVAQNMLEEGNNRAAAEAEIDTLLSLIQLFKSASLSLGHTDDSVSIKFQVVTSTQD